METRTSESLAPGARLRCGQCGTEVRLDQVGGGRMQCCDEEMEGAVTPRGAGRTRGNKARCEGCGNEVTVESDGGGTLSCCNEEMDVQVDGADDE